MSKPVALTVEQNNSRLLFIGRCVDENLVLPNSTKFGVSQPLTVQDLSNASNNTLEQLYLNIQKQLNESSLGLKANKPLEIAGLPAQSWLDFIKLTVQNREYQVYKKEQQKKKSAIEAELDTMKSPSQKKKELMKKLAEIED